MCFVYGGHIMYKFFGVAKNGSITIGYKVSADGKTSEIKTAKEFTNLVNNKQIMTYRLVKTVKKGREIDTYVSKGLDGRTYNLGKADFNTAVRLNLFTNVWIQHYTDKATGKTRDIVRVKQEDGVDVFRTGKGVSDWTCLGYKRGKNNDITDVQLKNLRNGQIKLVNKAVLKATMRAERIKIDNLDLTEDGRLHKVDPNAVADNKVAESKKVDKDKIESKACEILFNTLINLGNIEAKSIKVVKTSNGYYKLVYLDDIKHFIARALPQYNEKQDEVSMRVTVPGIEGYRFLSYYNSEQGSVAMVNSLKSDTQFIGAVKIINEYHLSNRV